LAVVVTIATVVSVAGARAAAGAASAGAVARGGGETGGGSVGGGEVGVVVTGGEDGVVVDSGVVVVSAGAGWGVAGAAGGTTSCTPDGKSGIAIGVAGSPAGATRRGAGAARTTVGTLGRAGPAGTMPTGGVWMPAGPARSCGKTAAPATAPDSRTAATSRSMALMLPVPFADDITRKGNRLRTTGA
jgi:hypothetical protein